MSQPTRLERFLRLMQLRPAHVVETATRVARRLGVKSVSRQHFARLRNGASEATEEKILLIVATLRSMTGLPVAAADLFEVEPQPVQFAGDARGVAALPPFASRRWAAWRPSVTDDIPDEASAAGALEVLYHENAALMRVTAKHRYKVPPEDVDALVHDVFASFLERQPRVDDVRAFLLAAVGNACRHYWRKRRHECPLLPEHEDRSDSEAERRLERWSLHLSLGATLARLGEKCRETLERYYLRGERPAAIAKGLDTTPAYVFQLLHLCRKRAREIFRTLTEPQR